MSEYNMFEEKRKSKAKGLVGAKRYKKFMYKKDIISELTKIEKAYDEDIVKGRKLLAKLRRMFMVNENKEIELVD